MVANRKKILFGAGIIGRRALSLFGTEDVYCFADNNKAGQTFWGKPVISFDELKRIHSNYDVVITGGIPATSDIAKQCKAAGIICSRFDQMVSHEDYESNPEIVQFKDKHKGERCFLIGNGPSLRPEDLTVLHKQGEICFGCNAISKIFDKTPWRPDYFMFGDPAFLLDKDMVVETEAKYKFIPFIEDIYRDEDADDVKELLKRRGGHIMHFHRISFYHFDEVHPFSPDVSKAVYLRGTVVYGMIQFAVYMGFSEIYLLGVDGTGAALVNPEQYMSEKRHFYDENEEMIRKQSKYFIQTPQDELNIYVANSYKTAEAYTRERGISVYNATRGGVVDAFERIDFDSLFSGNEGV